MGESDVTLPEMLNIIEDGAQKIEKAKEAIPQAYEDMKNIVSVDTWDPSRYSAEVKNLMEEIDHSIIDELYGLLYNEDDVKKLKSKLSDIIQAVHKCRSAFLKKDINL